MGLFSYNCKSCGHPALATNLKPINRWMRNVVAIFEDGQRIVGEYDGYGTIGDSDRRILMDENFTLYHAACEEMLGAPQKYSGPSESADDQGHFYEAGAHDMPDPRGKSKRRTAAKVARPRL